MDKFEFGLFQYSRASNSEVDSRILPNFKLVQDFMPIQFICKFNNELIKNKNIDLIRGILSVLVTCKIEEELIKNKGNWRVHIFSEAQGQVTQNLTVKSG